MSSAYEQLAGMIETVAGALGDDPLRVGWDNQPGTNGCPSLVYGVEPRFL